jgi:methyl-accepting chemotaxis protein
MGSLTSILKAGKMVNHQVEEVTASAQSLAEMAQILQDLVAQFKVDES